MQNVAPIDVPDKNPHMGPRAAKYRTLRILLRIKIGTISILYLLLVVLFELRTIDIKLQNK